MADEQIDIEIEQEDPKDPFAKYGGKQIEDPFKKYGGKSIEVKKKEPSPFSSEMPYGWYGEPSKEPAKIPSINYSPTQSQFQGKGSGVIEVDPEFETAAAESNKPYEEFNQRLVGRKVGTATGDIITPYNYQAPIDKQEAYPSMTEFKQGDIIEDKTSPTGYKAFRYADGQWQWSPIVRPKKISGINQEVVVKALKPSIEKGQLKEDIKQVVGEDKDLQEFVNLSKSDLLNEKLVKNPGLKNRVAEILKANPTKARTGDGRISVYEEAVVKNYKLDKDPFIIYPKVDHAEFQKNIKAINGLDKSFEELKELTKKAKNIEAQHKISGRNELVQQYNNVVSEINTIREKTLPLTEYFGREDVSEVLHLMALQERGQQELSSALNYFPGYRERKLEAENKALQEEGALSGAGKSIAKGALDLLANIGYSTSKILPIKTGVEGLDRKIDASFDAMKDQYDLWAQAKLTTGKTGSDVLDFTNQALQMLPQMAAIMATKDPKLAAGIFVATPSFGASYKESLTQGLTKEQAFAKGIVDAGIETLSESIVGDRKLIKGFKPSNTLRELGEKEFGSEAFNKAFTSEIRQYIASKPQELAVDYLGQLTEEVVAMKSGQLSNAVANSLTGSDFETEVSGEDEKNLLGSVALITLGTKLIGGSYKSPKAQGYKDIVLNYAGRDFDGAMTIIEALKSDPNQNPEFVEKLEADVKKLATMKFPEKATPEQKVVLLSEVDKLRELEEKKEGLEKEFQGDVNEKIKEQKEKIDKIQHSPKLAKEILDESTSKVSEEITQNAEKQGGEFIPVAQKLTGQETVTPPQEVTPSEKVTPLKESGGASNVGGDVEANPFSESKIQEPVYRANTGGAFSQNDGKGTYFTTNKEYADLYNWDIKSGTKKEGATVDAHYVDLKNPLIIETKGPKGETIRANYDKAIKDGHDGIIAKDPNSPSANEILVFNESQIKKASQSLSKQESESKPKPSEPTVLEGGGGENETRESKRFG